ncbi:MAG: DUF4240 domain-containing protein [Myxococcota bacterium]|nr:DUF4240 domain-containing protein [Myxococcota bacterium]
MEENRFWEIIETCFTATHPIPETALTELERTLRALPRPEVVGFQRALNAVMARAYTWDLIGAACFVGSGQSDDGFEDFRAWLISKGHTTFERVLADPSALAELPFDESPLEEWGLEPLHMLPGELAGEEDDPEWPYYSNPDSPSGEPLELRRQELRRRFPALWSAFGDRYMIIRD